MSHKIKVFGNKNSDKSKFLLNVYLIVLTVIVLGGGLTILHLVNENHNKQEIIQKHEALIQYQELQIKDIDESNAVLIETLEEENVELSQGNEALNLKIEQLEQQVSNKDKVIRKLEQEVKQLEEKNANFNEVSRGGDVGQYRTFIASAYTKNCYKCSGITKSGINLHELDHTPNLIAADPNVLPLGTKIEIKGMGTYTVEDTGGAIINRRVDILFPTKAEANEFGVQEVKIKVIKQN